MSSQLSLFRRPINLRGQFFSGLDHRVYLLGNPLIWWGNLIFLGLFLAIFAWNSVCAQRGVTAPSVDDAKKQSVTFDACLWLFLGWGLHYVPFCKLTFSAISII